MKLSEITDREGLEAWLNALPQDTEAEKAEVRRIAVTLAFRAAARVLPVLWEYTLTSDDARKRGLTALPILHSLMISCVAALVPTQDIRRAAATTATAKDVWTGVRADAKALTAPVSSGIGPLWKDALPFDETWADIEATLQKNGQAESWGGELIGTIAC